LPAGSGSGGEVTGGVGDSRSEFMAHLGQGSVG